MNPACVCLPHNAGLCSLINNVITCLGLYEYVHVDWSHPRCLYGNAWPELFVPNQHPRELGLEWVEIDEYPDYRLTGIAAKDLYQSGDNWRYEYRTLWQKLLPRWNVLKRADDFIKTLPPDYISVQVRSERHGGEQATGKPQTKEQYFKAIDSAIIDTGIPHLLIVSSDTEALEWFRHDYRRDQLFYYPNTRRTNSRSIDPVLDTKLTIQDAVDCMVEVLIMSQSKMFIHPVSNMATCALGINPEMKSVYLP